MARLNRIKRKRTKSTEDKKLSGLEAARARKAAIKEAGGTIKQRNPYEVWEDDKTSLRKSVNAMCFECNGGENYRARTKYCVIFSCPLWNVRPYSKGITEKDCNEYVEAHHKEDTEE